jgi:alpha-tubulin suppressor-like RCC1 family protein
LLSLLPYTYLTTANTVSIVNAPRAGLYSTTLGQYVACAVMTDRVTVKCWGRPQGGAIGQSDPYVGDEPNEMGINLKPVSLGTGLDILEVKTHSSSNCALVRPVGLPDRKLKCWGYASNGNLGNGDAVYHRGDNASEMGDFLPFVNFGTHNVVDFSVGNNHACAILDGLTATQSGLTCWGAPNSYGALGNGVSGSNGTPGSGLVSAPSFVNFVYLGLGGTVKAVKVGAGNGLTCALGDDQRVYCFGDNANGELGMGNTANYSTRGTNSTTLYVPPIDLGTDSGLPLKIADIAVGDAHVCAMSITGRVKCWGYNGNGQLGLEYVLSPLDKIGDGLSEMGDNLAYTNFGTTTVARQVFAGPNNTCIISTLGKVSCIGYGLFGVNGVSGNTLSIGANANQMGDSLAPVDLGPNRTAITLSVGPDHMCAILDNNTLKCWGTNTYGQLGLGSRTMYGGSSANSMGIYLPFVSLYLGP